ncbi:MAG TPA: hypothetical protein VGQ35_02000 [Dongiaceae bacterium]|jgi:tetratricopeptide (TPR) repeat protein|nr:hypothetical protein [Dongiaceae bacterium]
MLERLLQVIGLFARHALAAILRPADCTSEPSLSARQAVLFVLVSAALLTSMSYSVLSDKPALVQASLGPAVILASQVERDIYAGFATFALVTFPNIAFIIFGWIIALAAAGWFLGGRRSSGQSYADIALQLTAPICAARVAGAAAAMTAFHAAETPAVPSVLFLALGGLYFAVSLYFYLVPVMAIRAAANISWTRSITAWVLAGLTVAAVIFFASPLQLYQIIQSPRTSEVVEAEELLKAADLLYSEKRYGEALESVKHSLELVPDDLRAQVAVVQLRLEQCFADPVCLNHRPDVPDLEPGQTLTAAVADFDKLREDYTNAPAVQLYLADGYNMLRECDRAERIYREVLLSEGSLPHIRFAAGNILTSFGFSEDSEDIGDTLRAWSPSGSRLDQIAVGFRMMITTLIDIRADLAFTDPILGIDVRSLFAPASFRDLAMVRWQTQSWCAQDRQRGFWQP